MPRKRHKPEEIVAELQRVDVLFDGRQYLAHPPLVGVKTRKCTLCPFHENKRGIQRAYQRGSCQQCPSFENATLYNHDDPIKPLRNVQALRIEPAKAMLAVRSHERGIKCTFVS